jgi:hypothetical protein
VGKRKDLIGEEERNRCSDLGENKKGKDSQCAAPANGEEAIDGYIYPQRNDSSTRERVKGRPDRNIREREKEREVLKKEGTCCWTF